MSTSKGTPTGGNGGGNGGTTAKDMKRGLTPALTGIPSPLHGEGNA